MYTQFICSATCLQCVFAILLDVSSEHGVLQIATCGALVISSIHFNSFIQIKVRQKTQQNNEIFFA